jgi:hypothetical protein
MLNIEWPMLNVEGRGRFALSPLALSCIVYLFVACGLQLAAVFALGFRLYLLAAVFSIV